MAGRLQCEFGNLLLRLGALIFQHRAFRADILTGRQGRQHPLFGRNGDHLTLTVPITYPEAALGADVAVPTVDGEPVTIRVPPGTRSGRTFRVRGRGVVGPRSKGDLLVTVEVAVPQNMNDAERSSLEAYAAALGESPRSHLGV